MLDKLKYWMGLVLDGYSPSSNTVPLLRNNSTENAVVKHGICRWLPKMVPRVHFALLGELHCVG